MFDRVCIIGFGLIGSSLARALLSKKLARTIVCGDVSEDVCQTVLRLQIAHDATTDLGQAVQDCDLVIIAAPVGAFSEIGQAIKAHLKQGAIVTDTGSVKQAVIESLKPHIPGGVHFIPAHPIAGTENSGPESGFAELFINRWFLITPLPDTPPEKVAQLASLWEALESRVDVMDPKHHDLTLAITSHLPHLIAYTIVGTATALGEDLQREVIKFSASGFRDFTRIAASDPVMWRDIFLNNREAVLEILQRFNEDITDMQKAIRQSDGNRMLERFTKTRAIRRQVIDAGQADYRYSNEAQAGTPPVAAPEKPHGSES
jgi:cyclohexadieny/prephenate dehydrogenase